MTIAPMSVYTASSLKEKLLRGIDSEGNIVDMGVVRDVLRILENFELSKDDLEETRIGRYVNSMRKRTNDNAIARQSKSLIKKWQAVVEQAATATSVVSGTQSNPGLPLSHVSNHKRKQDDNESVANSNCDSNSPVSSAVGNGQNSLALKGTAPTPPPPPAVSVPSVATPAVAAPKTGLSLRIKIGKPSGVPVEPNDSSLSPALPSGRNGPVPPAAPSPAPSQPEKRRIKSTAEIAMELQQKTQLNLSSEIKEKLEKQRSEMPLQTINEPIPAPVMTGTNLFGHDRKRGKKRGPNSTVEYDNPPSPRTMILMASVTKPGVEGNEDSNSAPSGAKLLSAEKSEMVKRFLDSSVTPTDMPLTPASGHHSVTPEPESIAAPSEPKFVLPDDYPKMSTNDLYQVLSMSFSQLPSEEDVEDDTEETLSKQHIDVDTLRHPESRVAGVNGIATKITPSDSASADVQAMELDNAVSNVESVWTRWEDCVTLVSADADRRPVFILPFVDIPEDESYNTEAATNTTVPESVPVTSLATQTSKKV